MQESHSGLRIVKAEFTFGHTKCDFGRPFFAPDLLALPQPAVDLLSSPMDSKPAGNRVR